MPVGLIEKSCVHGKKYPMWNEEAETMPREGLRKLQLKRLKGDLRHAYENVACYRERCDQVGVRPADL